VTDPDSPALAGLPEPAADIAVECLHCGRASVLRAEALSPGLPLVHLTKRLRCSECGSRAVKAVRVETPRDVARTIRSRIRARRA
jgi:DNA-directed RNA polymerase subunit RPC12/RpoP